MNNSKLPELFQKHFNGTASEVEMNELSILLKGASDEELSEILSMTWKEQDQNTQFFDSSLREKLLKQIRPQSQQESSVIKMGGARRRLWQKISAAAAIIIILSAGTLYFLKNKPGEVAQTPLKKTTVLPEILPGGDKAVLTLADGRKIVLDSASNGALTEQGGIKVIKIGGQLSYHEEKKSTELVYNTITTPRGGQYQLELADGSRVWLNAASSLRFPAAFTGSERTVELTGEGYFEVAHNPAKPFHVKAGGMDVQVLGTHFNINSYGDEPAVKTTLLEGRVMVKWNSRHVYLNPGQQAVLEPGTDDIRINYDVDIEEVIAWKNGHFLFNNVDIQTVMRQVARWYDVDIVFEKISNKQVAGGLPRSQKITQLLKILEATGKVDFEINGRQIIVKPK